MRSRAARSTGGKRLTRFTLRGRDKVNAQWHLYCSVHNIEKLVGTGWQV
nr:transposase [uncultured Caldimonas sp.]